MATWITPRTLTTLIRRISSISANMLTASQILIQKDWAYSPKRAERNWWGCWANARTIILCWYVILFTFHLIYSPLVKTKINCWIAAAGALWGMLIVCESTYFDLFVTDVCPVPFPPSINNKKCWRRTSGVPVLHFCRRPRSGIFVAEYSSRWRRRRRKRKRSDVIN